MRGVIYGFALTATIILGAFVAIEGHWFLVQMLICVSNLLGYFEGRHDRF